MTARSKLLLPGHRVSVRVGAGPYTQDTTIALQSGDTLAVTTKATPAPVAGLDTLRDGWGAWREYGVQDYGLDSDFIAGQVTDLGTGKRITAKRQQSGAFAYVSGWYDTFGKFAQKYGTFTARLRWDVVGKGIWPAWWLLPEGQDHPYPEIDILEAYPAQPPGPNFIVSGVHYAGEPGDPNLRPDQWKLIDLGFNPSAAFHDYGIVWAPASIAFTVDGVTKATVTANLPQVPMYPILSLAMGAPGYRVDAATPSPIYLDCEWVRCQP